MRTRRPKRHEEPIHPRTKLTELTQSSSRVRVSGAASHMAGTLSLGLLLVLAPSVATVLRFSDLLNADGVQQSVMSIQHVSLFYWGQDRLVPVVSWLASPISDPTVNLWVCLTMQAACFYGLLLFIARRSVAAIGVSSRWAVVVSYLTLVVVANSLFSAGMMHSFAIEGQPYALSWLLAALSYEAWKSQKRVAQVLGAVCAFVALGLNPSVVLLALFLATSAVIRSRSWLRWALFLVAYAAGFVAWSFLANRFVMYPTPAHTPSPSYIGFSLADFRVGFPAALSNVVEALRPVRTALVLLAALAAVVLLPAPLRAKLTLYGSYFAGFTLLYVCLFAGNAWVLQNGFHFRYFFPLQLLLLMGAAVPISAAAVGLLDSPAVRKRLTSTWRVGLSSVLAVACAALALAGPVRQPQDAPVFKQSLKTERYAEDLDVLFLSGNYWNMWPLMHLLLSDGRDGVFVASYKSGGSRSDYEAALADELSEDGSAAALCINEEVSVCTDYLDYWTRPGWRQAGRDDVCPAPPRVGLVAEPGAKPSCVVLLFQ